ncbi:hypothetical protein D3C78_1003780 [compost metagenome]
MSHALGDAAFGLKPCDKHLAPPGQALADHFPGRCAAVFVDPHQRPDFLFEAARQASGIFTMLLAEFLQTITDQPGPVAQVVLEIVFECLEVFVTQGPAETPDTGFADADFRRQACRGFERQVGEVGEHVAGDLAPGSRGTVQAVFQALFDRLAHGDSRRRLHVETENECFLSSSQHLTVCCHKRKVSPLLIAVAHSKSNKGASDVRTPRHCCRAHCFCRAAGPVAAYFHPSWHQ